MNPTQEKIVEYLNKAPLGLTKSSTDEDIYMMEFLETNGLLSRGFRDSLSINMNGQAYIRNSHIFENVPLDSYGWKMNIIDQLRNGQKILDGDGEMKRLALNESIQDGIVEAVGRTYFSVLTSKGRRYINSGLNYNDFMNDGYKSSFHIGHNIAGNIQRSRLNINLPKEAQSNINAPTKAKPSIIEIFYWIGGILLVIMGLYEFVIKHLSWH